MANDPMGLQSGNVASDVSDKLRQIIMDRLAQQETLKKDALAEREMILREQEAQQRQKFQDEQMRQLQEERTQRIQSQKDTSAAQGQGRIALGDSISPESFAKNYADSSSADAFAPQVSLAAKQTAGAMPLDPTQGGASTTTQAPRMMTGRMVNLGTDKQQEGEKQKQIIGRLMANPGLSSDQKLALEAEQGGLKVPSNFWEMKQQKGDIKETPGGFIRIGPNNDVTPIVSGGKPVQPYHAPVQPIVVQTGTGPQLLNRGTGTTSPIKDAGGADVGPAPSGQEKNRKNMADSVGSHLADLQSEIDEADSRGLLGPGRGRVADFLSKGVGSTGNPANDELLGQLHLDLSAVRSGFASLHGRGGANSGVAKDLLDQMNAKNMSRAELTGALKSMKKWVDSYAGKSAPAPATTGKPTAEDLIKKYGGGD